ncbi:hypothetical protein [Cellulomonas sp. A375-1]|uniref:hypothetical protein n=1 Tax=Cellulomonas sp. A375-1 TaxID=1672219 RepID=UPI00069DEC9D|nr:hypothetical protein [Cellulomonas sp. A375-1]
MSRTTSYVPGSSVVDMTAPDFVAQLLAFHRATFGDAVMEATGDAGATGQATGTPGEQQAAAAAGVQPASQAAAATDQTGAQGGETLPDDPAALKAEIARLRRENASSRTNAKATAAQEARDALVQDLGKALGLVTDGNAAPTADQLATQVQAAQQQARQAAVELAVYRAAGTHQGDPAALLDSRAFLAKVADLDPTAEDFTSKVDAAIKDAVAQNPKLKTALVAGSSSVDHTGGTGEGSKKPTTLAGAIKAHYGTA